MGSLRRGDEWEKWNGKLRRDEETKKGEMGEGRTREGKEECEDGKSKGRDMRKKDWGKLRTGERDLKKDWECWDLREETRETEVLTM